MPADQVAWLIQLIETDHPMLMEKAEGGFETIGGIIEASQTGVIEQPLLGFLLWKAVMTKFRMALNNPPIPHQIKAYARKNRIPLQLSL